MLAQLTYPAGTSPANISNDIVLALTGQTSLAAFSASLVQASSSIISDVPATWETQTANTAPTDVLYNGGTITAVNGSIKALRQPVASNPSVYKYLKFCFVSFTLNSAGALKLAANIGTGLTSGTLVNAAENTDNLNNSTIGCPVVNAAAVTSLPVKVIVYSDAAATVITITEDTFYEKFCFAVLDIANEYKDVTGYVPTINVRANNPTVYGQAASSLVAYMPAFTKDTATYANSQNATLGYIRTYLTTKNFVFDDDRSYLLGSDKYKFENFSQYGTRYQLMPFGVSVINARSIKNASPYSDLDYGEWAIPYSASVSSGVYLCNYYAFGRSGNFYDTTEGVLCKMGNFMVKVQ